MFFEGEKRGQITIFIIVAVVLIGFVIGYFVLRDSLSLGNGISSNLEPVYTSFLSCLEEDVLVGVDLLETQAGYIEIPPFEAGSTYMPFSSQLNFLGNPIPYWYYVSGNNLAKENVPTVKDMESSLASFVDKKILNCDFQSYYDKGFIITVGDNAKTDINIVDKEVRVDMDLDLEITYGNESILINNHDLNVKTYLGQLYDSAKEVYDYEQKTLFLENYAVDTLRTYAPVDGVKISCSPLIWSANDVFNDLQVAIEANTGAIKTKGNDYSLTNEINKYFIVDLDVDADVRFLNSQSWAYGFDVNPSQESVLIAKPVGDQPGMSILGFCYVPYHFVYNLKYPVLAQVMIGEEIFQFPMAVVVEGNKPRTALDSQAYKIASPEICEHKNTFVEVNTFDVKLNPVEAKISYECFNDFCEIGKTSYTKPLVEKFPQCVNGYILARADGFRDARYLYSTMDSGSVDIIMDKLHEVEINLKLDGKNYDGSALINFISEGYSKTVVYPEQTKVNLSEGQYEIQVSVYQGSSIGIPELTNEQCIDAPSSGLGGLFGLTEKKCFEINIPSQVVSNALAGGGKENYFILDSELESATYLEINSKSLPLPNSLEQLQKNYIEYEAQGLEVVFR